MTYAWRVRGFPEIAQIDEICNRRVIHRPGPEGSASSPVGRLVERDVRKECELVGGAMCGGFGVRCIIRAAVHDPSCDGGIEPGLRLFLPVHVKAVRGEL